MDGYEKIASNIFNKYGMGFNTAERAGGWTNAVWINGDYVLRLSKEKGSNRLLREAQRTKYLPATVGYPKCVASGVADGYEWCLSERISGSTLSHVWNNISWSEKTAAVAKIINIMNAVHTVDVEKIENITFRKSWYCSFDKNSTLDDINTYVQNKIFTPKQGKTLCEILERFFTWHSSVLPVLCHGDITADNLIWHNGNVVALLDFEHSAIAPRQLDVHSVVNLALIPYDEASSMDIVLLHDENNEIQQYVSDIIPLIKPYLSRQCDKDLFIGYNVLFRKRFLEFWLNQPNGSIDKCDAYIKMLSFCDGDNGYLAKLM